MIVGWGSWMRRRLMLRGDLLLYSGGVWLLSGEMVYFMGVFSWSIKGFWWRDMVSHSFFLGWSFFCL